MNNSNARFLLLWVGTVLLVLGIMGTGIASVGYIAKFDAPILKASIITMVAGCLILAAGLLGGGTNTFVLIAIAPMIGGGGGGCLTSLVVVGFVLAGAALAFRALWRFGMTLGILLAFASPAFAGGGGGGGGIELPGICWGVLALVLIVVVILAIKDIRSKGQQ